MSNVRDELIELQQRIASNNRPDFYGGRISHLSVTCISDVYYLDYCEVNPDIEDENYIDFLSVISKPEVANCVRSIFLRGPDEGANGTREWNLEPMLRTDAVYSQLEYFHIQLGQPGDHNQSIVGDTYEESGMLARLLDKLPNLRELTVPSAPNRDFFQRENHPLQFLSVDAGYDTQDFLLNLAQSSCFPDLGTLEWGDYNETYMEDFQEAVTPREHYQEFFQSKTFKQLHRLVLRNPNLSDDELSVIASNYPELELLVIRTSSKYIE